MFLVSLSSDTNLDFRVLVGLGALPLSLVFVWNISKVREEEGMKVLDNFSGLDEDMSQLTPVAGPAQERKKSSHRFSPRNVSNLIGTGGTWFLFDVAYYGMNCFTPFILAQIFKDDSLQLKCLKSLITACFQIPATIGGIYYLKHFVHLKTLNAHGFILMGIAFLLFSLSLNESCPPFLQYFLLNMIFFSIAFGCILATYILPTVLFAPTYRASLHGISAAAGKAGAAVGALLYPILVNDAETGKPTMTGLRTAMLIQFGVCVAGYFCNKAFIEWPPREDFGGSPQFDEVDLTPESSTGAQMNPPRRGGALE